VRFVIVTSILSVVTLASADTKPPERAAVAAVDIGENVLDYLATKAKPQIEAGLVAAGFELETSARLPSDLAPCREGDCVRRIGDALGVQAVVFATLTRQDDNIIITLRLIDTRTVQQVAEVREICELCGAAELGERLGVAASTLRARAVEARDRREKLAIKLQPHATDSSPGPSPSSRPSIVPGIAIGVTGVLLLGGGIALLAIDGRGACSPGDQPVYPDPDAVIRYPDPSSMDEYVCRDIYRTRTLGIGGVSSGLVALAAGTLLVIRARRYERVEVTPLSGGAAVKVSLPW
jgi:hypothetical protein